MTNSPAIVTNVRGLLVSPRFWFAYHAGWSVVWAALFIPAMTIWSRSIPFLMFVSMQTALGGSLGGVAAALGARKADPADEL